MKKNPRGWTRGRYSNPDEALAMEARIDTAKAAMQSCRECAMVRQLDIAERCTAHVVSWSALMAEARELLESRGIDRRNWGR